MQRNSITWELRQEAKKLKEAKLKWQKHQEDKQEAKQKAKLKWQKHQEDKLKWEKQQKAKQEADDLFLKNFRHDSNKIRDAAIKIIREYIVASLANVDDPDSKHEFNIWNLHINLHQDQILQKELKTNIPARKYFLGFWNYELKMHDTYLWKRAGVMLMREEINKVLYPGIQLIDISDQKKAKILILDIELDFMMLFINV